MALGAGAQGKRCASPRGSSPKGFLAAGKRLTPAAESVFFRLFTKEGEAEVTVMVSPAVGRLVHAGPALH